MIKKKELDIKSIVQSAYVDVKKEHGLLQEQVRQDNNPGAFNEPYNSEKTLAFLQIKPKQWGLKGTTSAQEIDAIIEGIVGNQPPGTNRFKNAIAALNKALGKEVSEFGLPAATESTAGSTNVRELFSSLQLNNLLHSIIYNQDPTVAGKIFEGLAARMFGGSVPEEQDAIQDLVTEQGKYISLKLIDSTTEIKGSKYNLAVAIAKNKPVTYLVCVKDKRDNPFSFKAFSFTIDRYNYFNFILKDSKDLSSEKVYDAINSIIVKKQVKENAQSVYELLFESDQKSFVDALTKYATDRGTGNDIESVNSKVREDFRKAVEQFDKIKDQLQYSPGLKKFYKDYIAPDADSIDDAAKASFASAAEALPKSTTGGKNPLTWKDYQNFRNAIIKLNNIKIQPIKKWEYFEDNEEILQKINSADRQQKLAIINDREAYYNNRFSKILLSLKPLLSFATEIEKNMNEVDKQAKISAIQAGEERGKELKATYSAGVDIAANTVEGLINKFFTNILDSSNYEKKVGGPGKSGTQFEMSIQQAKDIAITTGAEYDESYQEFIVDSGFLFNSAQQNAELLKQYVDPIYENFHYLDMNLKKYFIKDDVEAMGTAGKYTEELKTAISEHPGTKKKQAASELKENTQKPLTNDPLRVMLESLKK